MAQRALEDVREQVLSDGAVADGPGEVRIQGPPVFAVERIEAFARQLAIRHQIPTPPCVSRTMSMSPGDSDGLGERLRVERPRLDADGEARLRETVAARFPDRPRASRRLSLGVAA